MLGFLVGVPLLRLRGHYLAFGTLAFQLILLSLIGKSAWLGGDIGLSGIPASGSARTGSPTCGATHGRPGRPSCWS
ncbi:hypothetical protein ACGFNU_05605 [Spirillospora sp. NPDC048911]|uniref:hypothetical protein n=1 Tax=Spirillospora sp. NPDC048911 TaxID=3364527 RepID=UPI0037127D34